MTKISYLHPSFSWMFADQSIIEPTQTLYGIGKYDAWFMGESCHSKIKCNMQIGSHVDFVRHSRTWYYHF
jgi:hypothetical protein